MSHTGSETVLDAIGQVYGLPAAASKNRVWLARPSKDNSEDEILPIHWREITQQGRTATNYQIYPGDRIYVAAQPLITVDTMLGRAYLACRAAVRYNTPWRAPRSAASGTNGQNGNVAMVRWAMIVQSGFDARGAHEEA